MCFSGHGVRHSGHKAKDDLRVYRQHPLGGHHIESRTYNHLAGWDLTPVGNSTLNG